MTKNNKVRKIINQIENIRKKNNKNWMNLLRLAFKLDPKSSGKILSKITQYDRSISALTKKLQKITK